jgi:SNF2 domain-containing protein
LPLRRVRRVRVVQNTAELDRVLSLLRREWPPELAEELARRLTVELRLPEGSMTLRPVQAVALAELRAVGGLFAPIRVGAGKTLISLLAGSVVGARRPMLLVPAKLRDKTQRDLAVLRRHWRIPLRLSIVSYETLSRVRWAEELEKRQPDLLICDEVHRIKNPRAAVTKRVLRALAGGHCRLVAMSGTITRRSLRDYAHLLIKALGPERAPVPRSWGELEEWSDALDETKLDSPPVGLGALSALLGPEEAGLSDPLVACRRGYRRRLVSTPGIVATEDRALGVSLAIRAVRPPVPEVVRNALGKLRSDWELPDGTPLGSAETNRPGGIWAARRQLALGFFYRWDPPPPKAWLEARREWCQACRAILSNNRRNLDSELQVANAVDAGLYKGVESILARWRAVRDSFVPNPVPVWLSDEIFDWCRGWQEKERGIVWIEHRAWGERWEPYYGAQGRDRAGRAIEDADPSRGMGASIASNSEGRNLQAWNRNLVVSPPAGGSGWEQLLGRTHRDGQEADEVSCEFLVTCPEHLDDFNQARRDATYVQDSTGQAQKLLYADVTCE